MKILRNINTLEERQLIRCGMTACDKVIHVTDAMGYDKNYNVYCIDCSDDLFVARGYCDDDWISGDSGWDEVEVTGDALRKYLLSNIMNIQEIDRAGYVINENGELEKKGGA